MLASRKKFLSQLKVNYGKKKERILRVCRSGPEAKKRQTEEVEEEEEEVEEEEEEEKEEEEEEEEEEVGNWR